jgi:peptidylprolyl isomerase
MRFVAGTLAVAFALLACGCGGDESPAGAGETLASTGTSKEHYALSDPDDPRFATISRDNPRRPGPALDPASDLPPPKKMMIRDLEVGSGPAAAMGDRVGIRYVSVNYKTGDGQSYSWEPAPQMFQLGSQYGSYVWQEGIVGMRPGGRRELILPAQWASGRDAVDYVVELVRLEPASDAPPAG